MNPASKSRVRDRRTRERWGSEPLCRMERAEALPGTAEGSAMGAAEENLPEEMAGRHNFRRRPENDEASEEGNGGEEEERLLRRTTGVRGGERREGCVWVYVEYHRGSVEVQSPE